MHYFPPQAARVALTYGGPSFVEALPPLPPTHAGGVSLRPVESAVVFLGLGAACGSPALLDDAPDQPSRRLSMGWRPRCGVPGVVDVLAPTRHADLGGAQTLFPRLVSFALAGCPCLLLCSRPGGAHRPR